MKKLLLSGVLLTGLLSQSAFAAGISGNGCALSTEGTSIEVTLLGGTIDKEHGTLQAGSRIRRAVTFAYDLGDHTEGCANEYIRFTATELTNMVTGPIRFDASAIRVNSFADPGIENSSVTVTADGQANPGVITLEALYTVLDPDADQLAQAFSYGHTFKVDIVALASPINDIESTPSISPPT